MLHRYALALAIALSLLLSACGGGGSGGGSSFDPANGSGLSVSPESVGFASVHNGATPPPQTLNVTVSRPDAVYVAVGFPPSVAPPSWLGQTPVAGGSGGNYTVTGGVTTTSMPPGTYSTTVRVYIQDLGHNILAYRDVPLSYTITNAPVAASPSALNFLQVAGSPAPPAQAITVMGDVASWTASADQPWIALSAASGAGGDTVSASVDTSGLAPGSYSGTIMFSAEGKTAKVSVSLTVALPDFQSSLNSLSFSGVNGATLPGQSLLIGMNNGAPINWNAASGAPWLVLDRTSGTQSDPLSVSVNPAIGPLASGVYNSTITLTGSFGGRALAKTVGVTLTLIKPVFLPSASSFSFSGVNGATLPPASLSIGVSSGTTTGWNAASGAPWLVLDKASGTTSDALGVSVNPAIGPLASGVYNSTITLTGAINGDTLTETVNVKLTLIKPVFLPSPSSLSFSGINGATLSGKSLGIGINNGTIVTWNAASGAPWLVLDKSSGTTAEALGVGVDPAIGPLASGVYNSTITLTGTVNGDALTKTVNVALSLTKATLTVSPSSVTFGGKAGRDLSAMPVQLSLDTGANAFAWTSTVASFVQGVPASGSASATPLAIALTPSSSGLVGGTYTGSLNFSTQINGDTVTASAPLTFNLDAHKLLVDGNGVAFASTPGLSSLTRTLRVRDNFGRATAWQASSDQPWLTVTTSGTADGTASADLALSANPTGLVPDNVYLATVTLTSPDTSVENTEKVRVGLWVGSTTPAPQTPLASSYSYVAADPIRPYAYLAGSGGSIQIYNVYTAAPVATISGPGVPAQVGEMAVSHDGSTLYAIDAINFKIVPVNLDTLAVGTPMSPVSQVQSVFNVGYARTNGVELVVAGNGEVFNAKTGTAFDTVFSDYFIFHVVVAAARNGTRLCHVNTGATPYSIGCYPLDYTSANGGQLLLEINRPGTIGLTIVIGVGGFGKDIAVSADGTRAYVAAANPYEFDAYDTESETVVQALPGDATPSAVEVAVDGRIFGGAASWYGPTDVWVYSPTGTQLATYRMAGYARSVLDGQLKVSGDGLRMIVLTDDPSLVFTTVGP
jgi:BACON domain-containing protein